MPKRTAQSRAERLAAAISRLGPLERDVYVLGAVEGLSNDEIASRLGLTVTETEQLLAVALCGLDRELSDSDRPWWRFW
jgi:DNA-directed RNA polymerase specialized sigma24 family protein